jgi:phosphatidylinositol phospholipase C, delta
MQDQLQMGLPILRRAANIHDSPPPPKSPSKLKLSTSIKLKFKEVKDGALFRSRSLHVKSDLIHADAELENVERDPRHKRSTSVTVTDSSEKPSKSPRISLDSNMPSALSETNRLSSATNTYPTLTTNDSDAQSFTPEAGMGDVTVPQLLQQGTPMTKVSAKQRKRAVFRLDPDIGQIIWESKKHRISKPILCHFTLVNQSLTSPHREYQGTPFRRRRAVLP